MTEQQNPYQAPEAELVENIQGDLVLLEPKTQSWGSGLSWIREAFSFFTRCPFRWNFVFLVTFILMMVVGFFFALVMGLSMVSKEGMPVFSPVLMLLLIFPVYLFMPVYFAGLMKACDDISKGGKIKISHIFAGLQIKTGQLILVGLIFICLTLVSYIPGILIMGVDNWLGSMSGDMQKSMELIQSPNYWVATLLGMILMLVVYSFYWFAPAIVILDGQKAWPAMKLSAKAFLKNIGSTTVYGLGLAGVFLLWVAPMLVGITTKDNILVTGGSLWFLIGFFVLPAVTIASVYTAYRSIFTEQ